MKPAFLRSAVLVTLASMSGLVAHAASGTFNAGDTLPSTITNGDIWTLTGNPAARTAGYSVASGTTLTIQSDTPGVYRTISLAASGTRLFTIAGGATVNFSNIILTGGNFTSGNNDGGAISITGGSGVATIGGPLIVRSNTAARFGGGISAAMDTVFTGNVLLDNNFNSTAFGGSRGGGMYAGANITFQGNAVFTGNSFSGGTGGAIYGTTNVAINFQQSATFANNSATLRAGALFLQNTATFAGNAVFTSNLSVGTASSGGNGAAIYGVSGVNNITFNSTALFSSNTAGMTGGAANSSGGAIYMAGADLLNFNNGAIFTNNTAVTGSGGAIYTVGSFTIAGSSTFSGNKAGVAGGAIFAAPSAAASGTFNATNGNITFTGNTAGAANTPNAIAVATASGKNLSLNFVTGANTIAFYDPITTSSTFGGNVTESGAGTVVFDQYASTFSAATTINSGTFKLTRGASYGYAANAGSFTLAAPAVLSGNGTILANTVTLTAGSSLEVLGSGTLKITAAATRNYGTGLKLSGNGTIDAGAALNAASITVGTLTPNNPVVPAAPATRTAQTLTFGSSTPLTLANGGAININFFGGTSSDLLSVDSLSLAGTAYLNLVGTGSGSYKIMTATTTNLTTLAPGFTVYVNGTTPSARYGVTLTTPSTSELDATLSTKNLSTKWTGAVASGVWKNSSLTDTNWNDGGATADRIFVNGDRVTFDDTATNKTVAVDTAGVIVADMIVNNSAGNDYTITGTGGITGSTTASTGLATSATGQLVKQGAGALNFANTGANNFVGGIVINSGTVGFTNSAQLGDGGNGITFTGNSVLCTNADNQTLTNNLKAASGITATINTGTNTLSYAGNLSGFNSTATLAKTGTGTLQITSNNSTFGATTAIQQGTLQIVSGAQLGGNITIASGAILAGSGAATGSVTSNAGGIIQIGDSSTAAGTLTVGNLSLNTTTLRFNIFSGNISDQINVTGALTGAANSNIIDINSGVNGTFTLGNVAALSGATVYIDGLAQSTNSRSTALLSTSGANLLLNVGADISRVMYWTGTTDTAWNNINWTDHGQKTIFANGDQVIFDSVTDVANIPNRTITIQNTGVIVSDMQVQGSGTYTFTGGGIVADGTSVVTGAGAIATGTGKLVKTGNGTLAFQNAANNFKGGIDLGGGMITFTDASQIGTTGTTITFIGSGTLAPAAANLTLGNNILVAASQTGAIDTTNGNNLTYTGTLIAGNAASTLAKTGAGILALASDNSAYTGQIAVNGGALLLSNTAAKLGGTVAVNSSGTFGGAGTVAATVNALANGVVQVGYAMNGAETLVIPVLNLAASSTLVGTGTLLGKTTLQGNAYANIANGQTLVIAGTTAGSGNLTKDGAGNLQYSGASALASTGTTIIDSGYVQLRNIATPSAITNAFVINGGWLDLSSSGTLNEATANNWSGLVVNSGTVPGGGIVGSNDRLTYTTGGTVGYNIGGATAAQQGIFVVIDSHNSTVTFAGNNTYRGYTRIDSGTLSLVGNNALGATTGTVALNGGILQLSSAGINVTQTIELRKDATIDIPYTGGTGKSLSGPITKASATPVTLTIANSNYVNNTGTAPVYQIANLTISNSNAADAMHVNPYINITARNIAAAGQGAVTLDNNSIFTYSGVSGTTANNFTGSGTLGISGSSKITLTGSSNLPTISITGTSNATASALNSLGSATTQINVTTASTITIGTPYVTLGYVILNNGNIVFAAPVNGAYKQATLSTLASAGASTITFNTNIAARAGDQLNVTGLVSGTQTIIVKNTGGSPANATDTLTLITAQNVDHNAGIVLAGGYVPVGMYRYTLVNAAAPSGGQAYNLAYAPGQLSDTGQLINNLTGALPLSWYSELDNVQNRMGNLRAIGAAPRDNNGGDLWVRGYGRRLNVNPNATGVAFTDQQYGADTGIDCKARGTTDDFYLGAFIGYGETKHDFGDASNGRSNSAYAGVYATYLSKNGWYGDAILKGNQFKNELNAINPSGDSVTGRYNTYGVGASLEGGKIIELGRAWFLEPQIQGMFATISGQSYVTSNNIAVLVDRTNTAQMRGGVVLGRTLVNKTGGSLQFYAKAHGAYQWTIDGRIYVPGDQFSPKIEGSRFETGGGFAWAPITSTQFYFDYTYANAKDYKSPWAINFGIRYGW